MKFIFIILYFRTTTIKLAIIIKSATTIKLIKTINIKTNAKIMFKTN